MRLKVYSGRLEGMSEEAREVKIFVAIAPVYVMGWQLLREDAEVRK